jgi:hypothetical protein
VEEPETGVLEVILALLLLAGEIHVASLLLNRLTGLFYLTVGGELLRWDEPAGQNLPQPDELPLPQPMEVLDVLLALLLLAGEIRVVSLLLNREEGLFYYALGSRWLRWKEHDAPGE